MNKPRLISIVSNALALAFFLASPIKAQTWTDLGPNTSISQNNPCVANNWNGIPFAFHDNCYLIVNAWGGAAWDDSRKLLYWNGGGHDASIDDSVFALDPGKKTITRLWGPAPDLVTTCPMPQVTPSNQPVAVHIYSEMVYFPKSQKLWRYGGADYCGDTAAGSYVFEMDMTNPSAGWTKITSGVNQAGGTVSGNFCVVDPTTADETVVCTFPFGSNGFVRWDRQTSSWSVLCNGCVVAKDFAGNTVTPLTAIGTPVFDPNTKRIWYFSGGGSGNIFMYDTTTNAGPVMVTPQASGCDTIVGSRSYAFPAADYDPTVSKIRVYTGAGNVVTTFDPVALTCTDQTIAGGPSASSGVLASNNGIGSRFRYSASLNTFVMLPAGDLDAYTLTLQGGSGSTSGSGSGSTSGSVLGLGHSTLTCLDKDGDGYGVGPGCLGPDADDTDATVFSPANMIAKYGSVNGFLTHIGYQNATSPATVWCVSPSGSDTSGASSTNADKACTTPFRTYTGVYAHLAAPYIVLFRQGTYTQQINGVSGTSSSQNVIMSYPGELATLDYSAAVGNAINMGALSYVTVDGLKVLGNPSGSGYASGTYLLYNTGSQTILAVNDVLTHCEISGAGGDSNVDAVNITNMSVIENVIHDPYPAGGQHNIYLGANTGASSGVIVRRNILYNVYTGGYASLQINGRCTGCYIEQNLLYNADGQQITFYNGVSNSFVRNNLVFNTGSASTLPYSFLLSNYDSGQCQVSGQPSICAWDQTGNVIENNTFWVGTQAPSTGASIAGPTFEITNNSTAGPCGNGDSPPCGNLGGNVYRNNIIVGTGSGYPAVAYGSAGSGVVNYLSNDLWLDNLISVQGGAASILGVWPSGSGFWNLYNCSSFNSMAASGSGACSLASPSFANVSTNYYNTPLSFSFALTAGSPAIGAGTTAGAPSTDIWGTPRGNPPAIGAYEPTGQVGASFSACDLNQDGVVNQTDVQIATNQALGVNPCGSADLQGNGQCNVVDVQRVINASLGGSCRVGQ